jgi:hypothetical protein
MQRSHWYALSYLWASYEETQETLALLKILALGDQQVEKGELTPIGKIVNRLRSKSTTA